MDRFEPSWSAVWVTTLAVAAGATLVACGSGGGHGAGNGGNDAPSTFSADKGGNDGWDGGTGAQPQGGFVDGSTSADPGDAGAAPILFYANTDDTLYSVDPANLNAPLTTIGKFDCVGPSGQTSVMTDIAVSETGKIYGVSPAAAWPLTVQPNGVVHCDAKWPLPYDTHFNGLTFAPANTLASTEVLIAGNTDGGIFQIDANTGAVTQVGTLGTDPVSGKPWALSGDIVFMANGGSPIGFATVRTCTTTTSCVSMDTLIEVDVAAVKAGTQSVMKAVRGPVKKGAWCTNAASPTTFGSMFGIVAYQDKVYGYSRRGDFIEIDNDDGTGCLVAEETGLAFAGAGINTLAPVKAPPPK